MTNDPTTPRHNNPPHTSTTTPNDPTTTPHDNNQRPNDPTTPRHDNPPHTSTTTTNNPTTHDTDHHLYINEVRHASSRALNRCARQLQTITMYLASVVDTGDPISQSKADHLKHMTANWLRDLLIDINPDTPQSSAHAWADWISARCNIGPTPRMQVLTCLVICLNLERLILEQLSRKVPEPRGDLTDTLW